MKAIKISHTNPTISKKKEKRKFCCPIDTRRVVEWGETTQKALSYKYANSLSNEILYQVDMDELFEYGRHKHRTCFQ